MESLNFGCRITDLGEAQMGIRFALDYLNLEKGILGGRYQTSVRGSVLGGGSGYALLHVSEKREIELPRRVPTGNISGDIDGYTGMQALNTRRNASNTEPKLVDWDWNNIREKWNNFKAKFLKILYLEPVND